MTNAQESRTAAQWLEWWNGAEGERARQGWYGEDAELVQSRAETGECFLRRLRCDSASRDRWRIVRAPGRVNLMGVHVDHRGGTVNHIALDREVIAAARPRADGAVSGKNFDDRFPPFRFGIAERIPHPGVTPWLRYLEDISIQPGHWSNYLAAGVVRLQDLYPDRRFGGMEMRIGGDIPQGAGVSSSSALVVCSLLATRLLEDLPVDDAELVERAGEAEWYVGTRGGMGDHASILLSRRGQVASIGFMPLTCSYGTIPSSARAILAHSGLEARKAQAARAAFNQRVAAYELGMLWLRENHPELHGRLERVRDISPQRLGISLERIYGLLSDLPCEATPDQIESHIVEQKKELQSTWDFFGRTHPSYPLREVMLFGASECARGRLFGTLLDRGELERAGTLMSVSHDGDRVVRHGADGPVAYRSPHTDTDLRALATAAAASHPEAALELQPGGYRCSVPEIDRMVDLLLPLDGVYGAGLTGAGLGGCIVALCDVSAVDTAIDTLRTQYYEPMGLTQNTFVCTGVEGARIV